MTPEAELDQPEFQFVAACCRWPHDDARLAEIREAAARVTDWRDVLAHSRRHRVAGLVHHAITAAEVAPDGEVADALARISAQIALMNARQIRETARVQGAMEAAGIPHLVLKGAPVAQLAYGDAPVKFAKDIDLLVPPQRAWAALEALRGLGYRPPAYAADMTEAQFRNVLRYDKDTPLVDAERQSEVELHWRAVHNPWLLQGLEAESPAQDVALAGEGSARSFADADLLAYLSVHGALHAWFRLKWIADFSALVSAMDDAVIVEAYRRTRARGGGICFLQGLAVRWRVLGLAPPAALTEAVESRRVAWLTRIALENLTGPPPYDPRLKLSRKLRWQAAQFRLGDGARFAIAQARLSLIGRPDLYLFPLPPALHFLYVPLRIPFLLIRWVRAKRGL